MPHTLHPAGCQLPTLPPYTYTLMFSTLKVSQVLSTAKDRYLPPIFSPSDNLLKQLQGEGSKLCPADLATGGFRVGELLSTAHLVQSRDPRCGPARRRPQTPTPTAGSQACGSVPHQHPSSGRRLGKDPERASKGTDQNQHRERWEGLCRVPTASPKSGWHCTLLRKRRGREVPTHSMSTGSDGGCGGGGEMKIWLTRDVGMWLKVMQHFSVLTQLGSQPGYRCNRL